jgi:hypothetical protein
MAQTAAKFTSKHVIGILRRLGLEHVEETNLRDWHRRGIFQGVLGRILRDVHVGTGRDRLYTATEVVFIACLVWVKGFARYGGWAEAQGPALQLYDLLSRINSDDPAVYALEYENEQLVLRKLTPEMANRPYRNQISDNRLRTSVGVHPARIASEIALAMDIVMQEG